MSFLNNCRSKGLANTAFAVICVLTVSQNSYAAEREDLYQAARAAYDEKDCVTALKNFYAFYVLNEASLSEHVELKQRIESRMANCESVLTLAIASNPALTFTDSGIIVQNSELGSGFSASSLEIQDFMEQNQAEIEQLMQNRKQIEQ